MQHDKNILTHIINLGQEITQVKDVDLLLEKILLESRSIVNADAGSIYVKQGDKLTFSHAQNDTLRKKLPPGKKLIYSTFSMPVDNRSIAGYVANTGETLNIPDVYAIDADVPYSFDPRYDRISEYKTKSMLSFALKTPQNDILGVLQLINAMDGDGTIIPFAHDDEPFIMHFANSAAIALERAQMTRALILRMLRMAEMRDPKETGAHVNRVGAFSAQIYEAWAAPQNIRQHEIDKTKDLLRMAAMLHDVGKVAISDLILKKPARLDVDEYEIMKQHTFLGARLFADSHSEFDRAAFHIALEHHERWDGGGYPGKVTFDRDSMISDYTIPSKKTDKKTGADIHLFGRIVAIADVYDALSSRRCYKDAWDESEVLATIREEEGRQFDPAMVDAFFEVIDVLRNIRTQYPDDIDKN